MPVTTAAAVLLNCSPRGSAGWAIGLANLAGVKMRKARIYAGLDRGHITVHATAKCAEAERRWTGVIPGGLAASTLYRVFPAHRAVRVVYIDPWSAAASVRAATSSRPIVLDQPGVAANHGVLAASLYLPVPVMGPTIDPVPLLDVWARAPDPSRSAIIVGMRGGFAEANAYAAALVAYATALPVGSDWLRVVVCGDVDKAGPLAKLVRLDG